MAAITGQADLRRSTLSAVAGLSLHLTRISGLLVFSLLPCALFIFCLVSCVLCLDSFALIFKVYAPVCAMNSLGCVPMIGWNG